MFLNYLLLPKSMSNTLELVEAAAKGVADYTNLEGRLSAKGVRVEGSPNFTIQLDGQKFEVSFDGDSVGMELKERNYTNPVLVDVPNIGTRLKELLGPSTPVEAHIRTQDGTIMYAEDVREILSADVLQPKKVYAGHSEMTVAGEKPAYIMFYRTFEDKPGVRPRIDLSEGVRNKANIAEFLTQHYGATKLKEQFGPQFELDSVNTFGDFVTLSDEMRGLLGASEYHIISASVDIPVRELTFSRVPPVFRVISKSPYKVICLVEPPHSVMDYEPQGRRELRQLKLEVPFVDLAKAARFYDSLKS